MDTFDSLDMSIVQAVSKGESKFSPIPRPPARPAKRHSAHN